MTELLHLKVYPFTLRHTRLAGLLTCKNVKYANAQADQSGSQSLQVPKTIFSCNPVII